MCGKLAAEKWRRDAETELQGCNEKRILWKDLARMWHPEVKIFFFIKWEKNESRLMKNPSLNITFCNENFSNVPTYLHRLHNKFGSGLFHWPVIKVCKIIFPFHKNQNWQKYLSDNQIIGVKLHRFLANQAHCKLHHINFTYSSINKRKKYRTRE